MYLMIDNILILILIINKMRFIESVYINLYIISESED